jgi:hypothetical protein
MAAAQGLKATHEVEGKVQGVDDKIDLIIDGVKFVKQVADDMDDQKRS